MEYFTDDYFGEGNDFDEATKTDVYDPHDGDLAYFTGDLDAYEHMQHETEEGEKFPPNQRTFARILREDYNENVSEYCRQNNLSETIRDVLGTFLNQQKTGANIKAVMETIANLEGADVEDLFPEQYYDTTIPQLYGTLGYQVLEQELQLERRGRKKKTLNFLLLESGMAQENITACMQILRGMCSPFSEGSTIVEFANATGYTMEQLEPTTESYGTDARYALIEDDREAQTKLAEAELSSDLDRERSLEARELIDAIFSSLNDIQREVATLRYIEGETTSDIRRILRRGFTDNDVTRLVARVSAKIRTNTHFREWYNLLFE